MSWNELLNHGHEPFNLAFPPVRGVHTSIELKAAVTLGSVLDTYLVEITYYASRHTSDLPKVPHILLSCPKVVRPFPRPF
ncbi:hypothetical protein EV424DRAFT_1542798 [Suillus variegatus]|nr:hypothetical protein EV424DRAFT_1542798 [Suillus variegatus]